MPRPISYIGDVVAISGGAVVATRGRGIFGIAGLRNAPFASYFAPQSVSSPGGAIASLAGGDQPSLPYSRVYITAIDAGSRATVVNNVAVRSDGKGNVRSTDLGLGDFIVTLNFPGDETHGSATATFATHIQ
jgi:hypothetical protein